jgi:hypothetical protein
MNLEKDACYQRQNCPFASPSQLISEVKRRKVRMTGGPETQLPHNSSRRGVQERDDKHM